MTEAVIVSVARTGIGKAYRGAFNDTEAPVLGGHVIKAAVERAGIAPHEVDDVLIGCAAQQDTQAYNLGRLCAYRSEEHTSELQSLMRNSYAVFCLKKKKTITYQKKN